MSQPATPAKSDIETSTIRTISWRLIPFLVLAYFFSYLDRVNLGFAALTMNADLEFTPLVFGLGRRHLLHRLFHLRGAEQPRCWRSSAPAAGSRASW